VSIRRTQTAGVLAVALALVAAGCGEKSEPDLSQIPAPPQPQPPNPPAGLPSAVKGQWQGTLRQQGVHPFAIGVRIASATDPSRNVVNYGGEIDCSGTWSYLSADGADVRFREVIDRGRGGKCKGTGTVTVRPLDQGAKLRYEFRGGGVVSQGVLSRRTR
jgi:hypothetical protein